MCPIIRMAFRGSFCARALCRALYVLALVFIRTSWFMWYTMARYRTQGGLQESLFLVGWRLAGEHDYGTKRV